MSEDPKDPSVEESVPAVPEPEEAKPAKKAKAAPAAAVEPVSEDKLYQTLLRLVEQNTRLGQRPGTVEYRGNIYQVISDGDVVRFRGVGGALGAVGAVSVKLPG
jgi:hypothetical protein